MKLAVRVPNWLGDAVMALPAVEALRASGISTHLTVVARAAVADVYRLSGLADEVIALPSPKGQGGWTRLLGAAKALRERRFDAGLVLPNSMESALVFRAAGIRDCWGYARDARRLFLRRAVRPPDKGDIPRHEVFYYLELLRRLEIIPALPQDASPRLRLSAEAAESGRKILEQHGLRGSVIALSPGAANSRAKQWPPERFVLAGAQAATERNAALAIFGTPQERELCLSIAAELAARGLHAVSLAGETSLSEFFCALSQCELLITNDSGGMHAGAALGVPTAAIFGPTIHEETGPLGAHTRVIREPVECSPCMLKDCPIDHRCMTRIGPERVAREALDLVQLRS